MKRDSIPAALLWLLAAAPAAAQPVLVLPPDSSRTSLAGHLEQLEDPAGEWSLADVSTGPRAALFRPAPPERWPESAPGTGIWVRFRLANPAARPWLLGIEYSALERVCVYWPETGGTTMQCTGSAQPFSTRPVQHYNFLFPVPEDLREGEPVYLYAQSAFPVRLPMSMITPGALYSQVRDSQIGHGLYFGFLAAMVLYNLFLFAGVRDPAYLYYSLHVAACTIAIAGFEGPGVEYLWPELPSLRAAPLVLLGAAFLFGVLYVRRFLLTGTHTPRLDRGLLAVAGLAVAGAVCVFFDLVLAPRILGVTTLLFTAGVLAAAILRLRAGYRPARFLLAAFASFLAAGPLAALASIDLLPWHGSEIVLVRIGIALGALLLSFGLADRVRQLSAERERLIPELEARNAEMERFVYTVSHDLKTPLITIRGFLGLLEQDLAAGKHQAVKRDVDRVGAAAGRMYQLLDELLELSRVGHVLVPSGGVALVEVAREAIELASGRLVERGVVVEVADELPVVSGDGGRLLEVFQNLLDNAVKFMGEQAAPRIEIGVREGGHPRDAGQTVIFVRDNGIGIPPEYQEKVFGLFERLDIGIEGTGVGLALVRRIVEVHGGRIWVESEGPGRGTAFCFTLPGVAAPRSE